jgi:hypothetical protein
MEISKEIFDQQRRPRFGLTNPERMQLAFWEWMIRGGDVQSDEEQNALGQIGLKMRSGKLKSSYGPYRARDLFNVPANREDGPIWTFDRMGATRTELPDGRVICIGGEHEDSYDPDFCIYNDVIIFNPAGEFEIYGYPKEAFPPTDFHTATLLDDRIIIGGGLGYQDARQSGHTPVYALELGNHHISRVETHGEMPGWIFKHQADYISGEIIFRQGNVFEIRNGKKCYRKNTEDYVLDLAAGEWKRLTSRNWPHFLIRKVDGGLFNMPHRIEVADLIPQRFKADVIPGSKWSDVRFAVQQTQIALTLGLMQIEIVMEGALPNRQAGMIAGEICDNIEKITQSKCLLENL